VGLDEASTWDQTPKASSGGSSPKPNRAFGAPSSPPTGPTRDVRRLPRPSRTPARSQPTADAGSPASLFSKNLEIVSIDVEAATGKVRDVGLVAVKYSPRRTAPLLR